MAPCRLHSLHNLIILSLKVEKNLSRNEICVRAFVLQSRFDFRMTCGYFIDVSWKCFVRLQFFSS